MSKRESVVLVSRAIATLMLIAVGQGLLAIIRLLLISPSLAYHPSGPTGPLMSSALAGTLWLIFYNLFVFALFWKCGPGILNFLLPPGEQPQDSSQPA